MILQKMRIKWDANKKPFKRILISSSFSEQQIVKGTENLYRFLAIETDGSPALILAPSEKTVCFERVKKAFGFKNAGILRGDKLKSFCMDIKADTPIYTEPFLNSKKSINLYYSSIHDVTAISGMDFCKDINVIFSDIFINKRYKVRAKTVSPREARKNLFSLGHCIFGFSLENDKFQGPKLEAQLKWISEKFSHCDIVIGDWMHHHTVMMNYGLNEKKAKIKAKEISDQTIRMLEKMLFKLEGKCKFNILPGSKLVDQSYYKFRDCLKKLMKDNAKFAQSARNFANFYVGRRDVNISKMYKYSTEYLLDELALFCCLSKMNKKVFLYPGTMEIFHEMSNGEHPGIPNELKEIISVQLKFNSTSQHTALPAQVSSADMAKAWLGTLIH